MERGLRKTAEVPLVFPLDEHNATLVRNVHPADWRAPTPAGRYNLVVIGAGTAGLVTAAGAAGLGARVALVERYLLGGDCLNVGCVPSKCIIRSSRVLGDVATAAALGVHVPPDVKADFGAVMERMRRLRARISHHDSVERFTGLGVDVFLGSARFIGPDAIEVDGARLRFAKAVIATGARAAHPAIPGLAEAGFLTNETVFWLTERPRRLAVIGGEPIGCELAQAFRRLGSDVVLFHSGAHLLNREDPDAAEIVQQVFLREGVRLVLSARVIRAERTAAEKVLHFEAGSGPEQVEVDEILVGAGRVPNVDGLGLEAAGVQHDAEGVTVDDHLRTTNPRIYAAGDICMKHKFTHAADAAARLVIQNALFLGRKRLSALTIPWCTFTDPEIAHVGLSEREAAARGIAMDTYLREFKDVDRAIADGEEEGFVKVHTRKGTDQILGATIVARHAGEMIGEVAVAMAGKIGVGRLAAVVHPYPTQAEAIRQVGDMYNRTRLTPFVKGLFERWLRWTR
jgi:pyruvate/2-oxoglutarate dehydrogenase complex dihydrolipoamide dehydrogenase (E3) component